MSSVFREFQVFVKPVGARCNLACSYCYYLENQDIVSSSPGGVMSDDILERYVRQHIEASTEPEIFFSWHGGEPTMAGQDFYMKAVEYQKRFKPEGSTVVNGIQTNATLITEEWGRFLSREGFYVGISLDGPEKYHSLNRTRRDGKGTFADVMRGLDVIRKHNVPHEFLCVVSSDNVHAPLELYRFFRGLGAAYITFLPMVGKAGGSNGKASSRSVSPLDFGKFLSAIFDEWIENDIGSLKVQLFEEALRTAFSQDHTLCIFKPVCGGVPVVEMNGDFYSCDHYVTPGNMIGNINDSPLAALLDHPRQKAFGQAKKDTLPRYCLGCEVLDMCNGECPKNRFITAPTGEPGLNYLCEGYRHFFNHCRPFVNEVARMWRSGG
ncbi:MAG: anaerobic sulfatase maturase [Bacteroidales bacterium]|nr:anaerobic sulfatase maturase [Bacteroidales bacterium]